MAESTSPPPASPASTSSSLASSSPVSPPAAKRYVSIDAYRGLVMLLMMAEVLHLCGVAESVGGWLWETLCHHQSHVPWRTLATGGWSVHDLIQPSFSFLVGTSLAFSIAKRRQIGQTTYDLWFHTVLRAVILTLLGVFLRSLDSDQTNWRFDDTLSQIGLGYVPLFAVALMPRWTTWAAIGVILLGWWAAFATYPLPPDDFDYTTVGVENDWEHLESGFAAHWQKNANLSSDFDQWLLNKFPRPEPFVVNGGGYVTLNFIPTIATMLLGLVAGRWIRDRRDDAFGNRGLLIRFSVAAVLLYAVGHVLDATGICPSVKRIWTPSWVLTSGGLCFALLAIFYATTDMIGRTKWPTVLTIVGLNSIAAYVMAWIVPGFLEKTFATHLGESVFRVFGDEYARLLEGAAILLVMWLVLFWMWRRRVFLKV